MSNAIYCHQCAKDNPIARKFCLDCATPLHLQSNVSDEIRTCAECQQSNPAFAKFCTRCSRPLVRTPSKGPGPDIPLLLINRQKTGNETCPGCGRAAEPLSHLVAREGSGHPAFMGPNGIVVEKPSWLEWNLREPNHIPSQRRGILGTLSQGCLFPLVVGALCLLVAGLRTFAPSSILSNPLVFVVAVVVGLGLAWAGWSTRRKTRLTQAQFRWRQARYCGRCDAVYVTDETLYTSPRHIETILWNTPSQFA